MRRQMLLLLGAVIFTGCLARQPKLPSTIPPVRGDRQTLYALEYVDVVRGNGPLVDVGQCVYAHYTGWLHDGTVFDSSRDTTETGAPRTPIAFPLGSRRVIAGWDTGFEGMRVGGQRRLFIPYQLAYGVQGRGSIPARAPLIFDVELMAVRDTLSRSPMMQTNGPPACAEWSDVRGTTGT